MKVRIEVDGKAFDVELRDGPEGRVVVVEGEAFPLRLDPGPTAVVRVGATTHTVRPEGPQVAVVDGVRTPFSILRVEGVAGLGGAAEDGRVRPPMTGRLDAVRVAEGQSVARGDVLFVLEAMKMRNEVRSPFDGTVAKVHARAGDTVEPRTVVLELAPAEPGP